MNINAKQLSTIDYTRMDITTVLSFFMQIKAIITANATLRRLNNGLHGFDGKAP